MVYKPPYTGTITFRVSANEGGGVAMPNIPCAFWELTRRRGGYSAYPEGRALWCCAIDGINPIRDGWRVDSPTWSPSDAYTLADWSHDAFGAVYFVTGWGVKWAGTSFQHSRTYCISGFPFNITSPSGVFPDTGTPGGISLTFDMYRPFGNAAPTTVAIPGVFYSDFPSGRGSFSGGNYLTWDGYVDFASSVDIRDGLSRAAGLDVEVFADGDELRIPTGVAVSRYVVVRVVKLTDRLGRLFKRAYVLRDAAHWPGP